MQKIKIITDSTADLSLEEIKLFDVEVIPLTVTVEGVEYDNIDSKEYIEKMKSTKNFSSSQPAIGKFIEAYEKWTNEGYTVISLHVSDVLSGTVNTAMSAAKEFSNVYVFNTKSASRGIMYFIRDCCKYVKEGKQIQEIVSLLQEKINKVLTYISIDNLDNLVKGGRVKRTAGLIGGLLNIKILAKLEENELVPVEKVRGKKKLAQATIERLSKDIASRSIKTISLPHALAEDYIEMLKTLILEKFGYKIEDKDVMITSPAISTHGGPGAVGILVELA